MNDLRQAAATLSAALDDVEVLIRKKGAGERGEPRQAIQASAAFRRGVVRDVLTYGGRTYFDPVVRFQRRNGRWVCTVWYEEGSREVVERQKS